MNVEEVTHWHPHTPEIGEPIDLSFLDAHWVSYADTKQGKTYKFFITYSLHCFAKEYEHQTEEEKKKLMYYGPKENRPFCYVRYQHAKNHLRQVMENLHEMNIFHAGYGSYASAKVVGENGEDLWYFIPFKVFKENKKYRIHVTSAYPLETKPGGGKVNFFSIAKNLSLGKALPKPRGYR